MKTYDIVIIGGGPAGLSAATTACDLGVKNIIVIERDKELGGILNQCIHNGFGLHTFKEELTGPEYAHRYIQLVLQAKIECQLNTMVISVSESKQITMVSKEYGLQTIQAKAIIFAMGCRERPRGALNIAGYRPAGIYSAGTAQRLVNIEGYMPGKQVVILGSGDIGLIMARRMTLEGAKVQVVAELMPYSGGLKRNIVQCLDDFDIPLKLSHTIIKIHGKQRVEGVTLAQVDASLKPILSTSVFYPCDTLLLSVGLIPENELSISANVKLNPLTNGPFVDSKFNTNIEGIFACGNVLHVHDLVDFVSSEASETAKNAVNYVLNGISYKDDIGIEVKNGIRYCVPTTLSSKTLKDAIIRFRVSQVYKNCTVEVYLDEKLILKKKKQIVVPSEMEMIQLTPSLIKDESDFSKLTLQIREEIL